MDSLPPYSPAAPRCGFAWPNVASPGPTTRTGADPGVSGNVRASAGENVSVPSTSTTGTEAVAAPRRDGSMPPEHGAAPGASWSSVWRPDGEAPRRRLLRSALRRHGGREEAAVAHERVDAGVAAAERAVALGGIDRVADGEDVAVQPLGDLVVVEPAGLAERLRRVGRQHVGPEVAVIAGRVAVAPEDVQEVRHPVAHHDLARHPELGERLALEGVGVDGSVAREVHLHVDQRAREVLRRREALVEGRRALDPVDQLLRDRLARLVMDREALEHLGRREPVLEELRWELDVVARDGRARERRVLDGRREPVQRVAELVEERLRIVPRDQDRLARRALHEVRVVRDDRRDHAVESLLAAVCAHPRAGPLAGTGEWIEVEEPDVLARRTVRNLPDPDVEVVDRDIIDWSELEAEELVHDPEHRVPQPVELEVRLDLVLVQVVLRLPDLLGVIEVVPRLDRDLGPLGTGVRLHVGDLLTDAGDGRRPHRLEQLERALGRLRHRVLEPPVRVRLVAEQLRALGPE